MRHSTYNTLDVERRRGFTLVELMITIAVLSVIVAIAIPAYNNYIRESHYTTMRATLNGMRTSIEDFRLENGNYGSNTTLSGVSAITGRFGWTPSGDTSAYSYTIVVTATNSYDAYGQFGSGVWVRCQNRYSTCCDSETSSGSAPSDPC
ncbi:MAG: prepilin-type N-terminal cleavage/methylation domain-containing protein [Gammaproteobacteria bacterium]|nr:prepilin-type N-terminal cleavage/methylation domain-containing protein [Gammaproteobacteria bacterium]